MAKKFFLLFVLCGAVWTTAHAQQHNVDPVIANTVINAMSTNNMANTILNNQPYLNAYRIVATEQAMAREAARRGLTERMDVQHNLQNLRRQALARALRDDIYRNTPAPTEEEIQATYDDNPERWVQPEAYLLDVLQYDPADTGTAVSAEELALQKIVEDDQLETLKGQWLATQVTGPWIASNQVDAVIWTDLAGLQDGQAMVFDNERATLFIRRGAHRMETVLPLEEVRADIRNALLSARQEEAWQSFVENEQKKLGFAPLPEQKEDEDEQANDQEEDIIDEQ